jgi:hypothetical protein
MSLFLRSAFVIGLLAGIAACSSNSSSGSTTPGGPNAGSTTITVEASNGGGLGGYEVTLSRGIGAGGPTGIIDNERTNGAGQAMFVNLPPSGQLCVYTSVTIGAKLDAVSHCAQPFLSHYTLKFGPHGP